MHRLTFVLLSAVSIAACSAAPASARASVVLKLQGNVVRHDANDRAVLTPLGDGAGLGPGETIRYVIVASNSGTSAALHLVPAAKIPSGTAYEAGSASTAAALRIEFSLDGGKTWAVKPLVKVQTPDGLVAKPADPSLYTNLRWIGAKPLQPKASVAYAYEVRVK
jgi:uncharacterized repeat protein (TIGR01451 family)